MTRSNALAALGGGSQTGTDSIQRMYGERGYDHIHVRPHRKARERVMQCGRIGRRPNAAVGETPRHTPNGADHTVARQHAAALELRGLQFTPAISVKRRRQADFYFDEKIHWHESTCQRQMTRCHPQTPTTRLQVASDAGTWPRERMPHGDSAL